MSFFNMYPLYHHTRRNIDEADYMYYFNVVNCLNIFNSNPGTWQGD